MIVVGGWLTYIKIFELIFEFYPYTKHIHFYAKYGYLYLCGIEVLIIHLNNSRLDIAICPVLYYVLFDIKIVLNIDIELALEHA